jgi:IS30 family transposase
VPDPRPPLRSAQRRFWRVLRDGGSVEHAAVAAGVAVRTGRTWFGKAGGMPPLCLVEPSSSRTLTLQERERIASGLCLGWTATRIAAELGRATSTVTREVKSYMRHRRSRRVGYAGRLHGIDWARDWEYSPSRAQHAAEQRLARPKQARLAGNPRLRGQVQARLIANHSPEQIAARLRQDFPDEPEMWVSHETIYQALYVQARGGLNRELTRHLRTGRTLRKPQRRGDQRRERIKGMVPIAERPPEVADRAVPGHWEGDLIVGKDGKSAIGTLVERTTRFVILLHLPGDHTAITVQEAMIAAMADLPQTLCQTLTWDQGIEMANHAQIAAATDLDIYFCDPHSPWQRGTNENTNGLLRQYFPKGTDLSVWGPGYLATVAAELNNRPRKTLDWKTPAEALDQLLSNPTAHVA